jgi:hypothetical protein
MADAVAPYSRLDRLVHRIAFAGAGVQLAAEDIENTAFGRGLKGIPTARPVFVTSLARAGTTVLFEILAGLPALAATTYRDMPFVLAPLLWSKLSGGFRRAQEATERAHGDGVAVGPDSPEGFEEVFWRAFWPAHWQAERIRPWTAADAKPEATAFLRRHMAKVILLHRGATSGARYLSKNNMNLARLALLPAMLPDAAIVVPLRDPFEHAASLLRQHANFTTRSAADAFTLRYMSDIGHHEFGPGHRPAGFPDFEALRDGRGPETADYWLALWIAAFREAERHRARLLLVASEALAAAPRAHLPALFDRLGLDPGLDPGPAARRLHPVPASADPARFDPGLAATARALHAALADGADVPAHPPGA